MSIRTTTFGFLASCVLAAPLVAAGGSSSSILSRHGGRDELKVEIRTIGTIAFVEAGENEVVYPPVATDPTVFDLSRNQIVDLSDLKMAIAAWGEAGGAADFNGDGIVDGEDLGMLLAAFGTPVDVADASGGKDDDEVLPPVDCLDCGNETAD